MLVRLRDRSRLRADLVKRRTQLTQKIRAQLLRSGDVGAGGRPVRALGGSVPHPVGAGSDPGAGPAAAARHPAEGVAGVPNPEAHRGRGVRPVPSGGAGRRPGGDGGGGGDHPVAARPVAAGERTGEDDGPGDHGPARRTAGGARRSRRRSGRGGLADPAALDEGCGDGGRRGAVRGGERSPGGRQLPADPRLPRAAAGHQKSPGRPRGSTSGGRSTATDQTPSTTSRPPPSPPIPASNDKRRCSRPADTTTPASSEPSGTDSSGSSSPCSATRPSTTPNAP